MTLFIVKDADGNLLTKDLSWSNDCEVTALFKTPHKDVALNQLLELNASDVELRAEIVACEADKKNRPVISRITTSQTVIPRTAVPGDKPCHGSNENKLVCDH